MASILESAPPKADRRIFYGSDPSQFAELRFPSGKKPWPCVINIHGGFWRARYGLSHAGHLCAALTAAGLATCNIEYRRVGQAGGGWPGSLEDVRQAYSYFHKRAQELGFDRERMIVIGHSAGGQLALCLAAHEPSLTGVVSLAGVLDLRRAYDLHLSNDAVIAFLRGTPQQVPAHYWKASPMNLKVTARQAIITGSADKVVPPEFSRAYARIKTSIGERVEFVEIPEAGHFDFIDPRTNAFAAVVKAVSKLVLPA